MKTQPKDTHTHTGSYRLLRLRGKEGLKQQHLSFGGKDRVSCTLHVREVEGRRREKCIKTTGEKGGTHVILLWIGAGEGQRPNDNPLLLLK